jgi:hypothetical protein
VKQIVLLYAFYNHVVLTLRLLNSRKKFLWLRTRLIQVSTIRPHTLGSSEGTNMQTEETWVPALELYKRFLLLLRNLR